MLSVTACACAWAQGHGRGLTVQAASVEVLLATPGDILSVSYRVGNETDRDERVIEELQLPEG
ncbi:MAG: hypothetical protein J7M38_06835 [Armatimonadetes bacterium]|nr:hypothetical protein [Armatimonadota bacterium]